MGPAQTSCALSLIKANGNQSGVRLTLEQRRYILGPSAHCDIRIQVGGEIKNDQAHIDVDENSDAWFTPLGGVAATVSCTPVHSRLLLRDNSLIEIGTRRFVFHCSPGQRCESEDEPSKPAQSPSAKRAAGTPLERHSRKTPSSPLRELVFASPHPTPGALRRPTGLEETVNVNVDAAEEPRAEALGRLRTEAEADARRIRGAAKDEAKKIIARAEDDAKRIREGANADALLIRKAAARLQSTTPPLFPTPLVCDGLVVLSTSPPQKQQNLAPKEFGANVQRANMLSFEIEPPITRPRSLHTPTPTQQPLDGSMEKAERCLAFFDKMVCLNFLAATATNNDQDVSLDDARSLLRSAGFSSEDIMDVLQLLVADEDVLDGDDETAQVIHQLYGLGEKEVDIDNTATISCMTSQLQPAIQHIVAPPPAPVADMPAGHTVLSLLETRNSHEILLEDSPSAPSTPSKRDPRTFENVAYVTTSNKKSANRGQVPCAGRGGEIAASATRGGSSSPAIRLHPAIRKRGEHILDWLKKYDPTVFSGD